jgi:hypothetical protein
MPEVHLHRLNERHGVGSVRPPTDPCNTVALRAAGELAREFLHKGTVGSIVINVRNEDRQLVLRAKVAMKADRVQ